MTAQTIKIINGRAVTKTSVNFGSMVIVIRIPPIKRIGPRTPNRCILASIRFTLYVSEVSLDTAEDTVKSSICLADKYVTFENRSCRSFLVIPPAETSAIRLAVTLVVTDNTAQTSITPPHKKISRTSPTGTMSSMIFASREGIKRSIIAAANFKNSVSSIYAL